MKQKLLLLSSHLFGKALRISYRILQIEVWVLINVNSNGKDMSSSCAPKTIRAREMQNGISAFHVVTVERVCGQVVLAGNSRNRCFKHDRRLTLQNIAAPNLYQRPVTK